MPISLDVYLVAGRYDAGGGQDPRSAEWPPHPARALSALRSVAEEDDLPALRELEVLPPPAVHASALVSESRSRSFVVTNVRDPKGGNLNHPGRTSGLRERSTAFPIDPHVQFLWTDDSAIPDETVTRLDTLARRVPYLGRSTSVVLMGVRRVADSAPREALEVFVPSDAPTGTQLRVPYSGYTDELSELYLADTPAWQASDAGRARQYYTNPVAGAADDSAPSLPVWPSPYPDLVVLRLDGLKPPGRLTTLFTQALRSRVMSQTQDPLPPALHGHGLEGQPHVAYLGLPFSGFENADGHLVALAVAIPGLPQAERRTILRGLLGPDPSIPVPLEVSALRREVTLRYAPDEWRPFSARPERWSQTSLQWVTVTPIVLDRYPKNGDLHGEVARSLTSAGYPPPLSVEVAKLPLTDGAIVLAPSELPRRAKGRIYCHARVTFDQPVSGPVIAGAGRYFGVGLFAPESHKEALA